VVVVVVPPLARGEDRQRPVVARIVARLVAPLAEEVRQRVDRERPVPEQHGRDQEAPDERRGAADEPERRRERDGRHELQGRPVEGAELRVLGEVADELGVRAVVAGGQDPPDVRVPEAAVLGRVRVLGGVGVLVVEAVMGRPPEHPLLSRALRAEREQELKRARGLEGPVREVAVVGQGHQHHAREVGAEREHETGPGEPDQDDADDRRGVHPPEGEGGGPEVVAEAVRTYGRDNVGLGGEDFCDGGGGHV